MTEIFLDLMLITGSLLMILFSIFIVKGIIFAFTPDNRTEEQKRHDAADLAYRMKKLAEQDQTG
jgi:cbb3-type cytochrome oxidase subunit 3